MPLNRACKIIEFRLVKVTLGNPQTRPRHRKTLVGGFRYLKAGLISGNDLPLFIDPEAGIEPFVCLLEDHHTLWMERKCDLGLTVPWAVASAGQ